ncbi:MAG: hypothetical protein KF836_10030 [Fimbriimonadaceae bacterium]|nr:hypothetical protein [Fimbriimonadaceae bacterium]
MNQDHLNDEQMDSLMRQIFGESEAGDLAMLEGVSPAALEQERIVLNNLRSELRGLKEVPECQLSTEHLRNAILNEGSGSKRTAPLTSFWKFAVPVAACAAIASWMMFGPKTMTQTGQPSSGNIAKNSDHVAQPSLDRAPSTAEISRDTQEPAVSNEEVTPPVVQDEPEPQTKQPVKSNRRPRGNSGRLASNTSTPVVNLQDLASSAVGAITMGFGGAGNAAMKAAPSSDNVSDSANRAIESFAGSERETAPADSNKVVLVGGGSQFDARANSAMEVDKRDVVFGG